LFDPESATLHGDPVQIWNLCIERGWQYHASVMGKDAQVVECPLYDGQVGLKSVSGVIKIRVRSVSRLFGFGLL
jgi:hypothetical protein